MNEKKMIRVFWFVLFFVTRVGCAVDGMFNIGCSDRQFWLVVKSNFLGSRFRFEVEEGSGVRQVWGQWAAECGYTLQLDSWGDLTLRVSYLACGVQNQGDSEFRLMLWFVNEGAAEEGTSQHPLLLSCRLEEPWRPREVVCEKNYMEISVEKQLPPDNQKGTEWVAPGPADDTLRELRVLFRVPDLRERLSSGWPPLKEESIPGHLVHLLGYSINMTTSRIVLRCAYGSRLAYTLQDGNVTVEIVSTTLLYRHQWTLLRVDTSVACTTSQGSSDGADVIWMLPWLLPPLVQTPLKQKSLKVAVGGYYISQCEARDRGYRIQDNNDTIEIRIPFGADGGRLKSGVTEGQYSQLYEVDVVLLREWEDSAWGRTQQRTFRTLSTNRKLPVIITDHTAPSGGELLVSVGVFLPDILLVNVSTADQVFTWDEAERNSVRISQVSFSNGTHSYLLQVPFRHPLVTQKYVGEGYSSYSLSLLLSFLLSPDGQIFHVPLILRSTLQDAVVPWLEGACSDRGVRIQVHYGNLQKQWGVYVGGLKLQQLLQNRQYILDTTEESVSIEIPLFAPGMDYKGLSLQGLEVSVWVRLVHVKTMEELSHLQECTLPVKELLVCLPDGQMVALLDVSGVFPPVDPKRMVLLDPSCGPLDTDSSRVLFSFPSGSCGSVVTHADGHVIYANTARYLPPDPAHARLHPHLYSVPLMCVFPESGPYSISIYRPRSTAPPTAPLIPIPYPHTPHTHSADLKWLPLPAGG
ncbi:uncharacterized protein LOC111196783 isoform X2 [Astyanax mexicanus]|uniref:uncharacterized protein LOC111196783 isoform X2 n=1 Tax=Astyanax mexicanus TaxID=7994 RepID=UPI0020CAB3A6|nr:uncharacterized protein LOC111196783 isoform X2 [Astyanax mexicanus]